MEDENPASPPVEPPGSGSGDPAAASWPRARLRFAGSRLGFLVVLFCSGLVALLWVGLFVAALPRAQSPH